MAVSFRNLGQMGRIGNSLFEIAATIALACRYNDNYVFPHWEHAHFFNLNSCFSNDIKCTNEYQEPYFHYKEIPYKENMNINGFYQSERYFDDCIDVIKTMLRPKIMLPTHTGFVSLHVRRTDYVSLGNKYYIDLMSTNYYHEAMDKFPGYKFMIFSDDINWCKQKFIGDRFVFSNDNNQYSDLSNMIVCENNIIANSSFSWWGAYLNPNPNKMVIAPTKWFGPKLPHNTQDLIPSSWLKI